MKTLLAAALSVLTTTALAQEKSKDRQLVEGFDQVEFHHDANRGSVTRDFRGSSRGYMTAAWWAPGQMKKNVVSWNTAAVPEKARTTFAFVATTSVLPSELTRGPAAKLSVNGREAVTFTLGYQRDFTWTNGDYELKFACKRTDFPYSGPHRQTELGGVSGVYELTVPADAVEAGKPTLIEVELQPDERWNNGWFMVKERRDVLKRSMESLQGEIEALRQDVATLSQQTHMLATRLYPELTNADRFQHQVIYTDGYRHLHPADLIKLASGELLITCREATEHYAQDGDVIALRSKDGGQTWGDKQVIAGIPNLDEREGCGIQLKDGTILVGVFYNNLYGADGAYKSDPSTRPAAWGDAKHPDLGAYITTSRDDGHTWSAPNYIDTTGMPFRNVEGPTDAPIEMPDGSVVMGIIGYALDGDAKNVGAVLLRSSDQGKTWKYVSTIAGDPGGKLGGFVEPGIVRTKTGRIVACLRNHGPDQAIWTTYSDDDGKTWQPVKQTAMVGHPVDVIQLSDGRLMASYGIRTPHARPQGVRACFSTDNGETWDIKTEVQIRNDFINWDIGYPDSVELPDGRVLTVYYYNLFQKFFLGGTVWTP